MQIFCQSDKLSPRYKITVERNDPETERARVDIVARLLMDLRNLDAACCRASKEFRALKGNVNQGEWWAHFEKLELSNKLIFEANDEWTDKSTWLSRVSVPKKLRAPIYQKKVNC